MTDFDFNAETDPLDLTTQILRSHGIDTPLGTLRRMNSGAAPALFQAAREMARVMIKSSRLQRSLAQDLEGNAQLGRPAGVMSSSAARDLEQMEGAMGTLRVVLAAAVDGYKQEWEIEG